MRSARPRISFMRFAVIWFSSLTAVTVVVVIASAAGWFLGTVRAGGSPMAGEWVGMCNGRPFVMVSLRPAVGGYGGTISIGNVKITSPPAAAEGQCEVKHPASHEHAMKITKAVVGADGLLTFDSVNGQEYEMKRTGSDTAELRFVATTRDESWFALRRVR